MKPYNTTKAVKISLLAVLLACSAGSIALSATTYTLSTEQENEPAAWKIVAPTFTEGEEAPDIGMMLWRLKKAGVNATDERGNTPLILAARLGDTKRVKKLLEQGAEVNTANETGTTPLMNAAFFEKSGECARLLLEAGAEVNVADAYGWTPLMFALLSNKRASFINELLKRGAYAEVRSKAGVSPMMVACRFSSDTKIVELLYKAAAEVSLADKKGNLPMHYAVQNSTGKAPEFIKVLTSYRAKPDARNRDGWTPLMFAAHLCDTTDSVKALIEAGAQVNARKKDGMTPLMLAACNVNPVAIDMMKMLLDYGADVEIRDNYGRHLRETAIREGHSAEVLRFIDRIISDSSMASYSRTSSMAQHAGNIRNLALDAAALGRIKKRAPAYGENHSSFKERLPLQEVSEKTPEAVKAEDEAQTAAEDESVRTDNGIPVEADGEKPEYAAVAEQAETGTPAEDNAPEDEYGDNEEIDEKTPNSPVKFVFVSDVDSEAQAVALNASEAITNSLSLVNEMGLEVLFENKAGNTILVPKDFKMRKAKSGKESAAIALHVASAGTRLISEPAFKESQIRANEKMRRSKKAREIAKARAQKKADKLYVTPLMLAATNENDEVAEIITYLLDQGEELEAKDGEGRTALACAIRYNARPLAARALIEAGADLKVHVNGNSLSKLIRFNKRISKMDRNELLTLLKTKK